MVNKQEMYTSFAAAIDGVVGEINDGWSVDFQNNPPNLIGFGYEVTFIRDEAPEPKKSRAEILADARAAKAAKKEGA
jgi:hypothetical protein